MIGKDLVSFVKSFGINLLKNSSIQNDINHYEKVVDLQKKLLNSRITIPKRVWIYWDSEEIPSFICSIINNNIKRNPDYEFTILNQGNLFDFIPEVEFHRGLRAAHKADYIRLVLLEKYGGVWIDATTILVMDLNWINEVNINKSYDVIGYYRDQSTENDEFPIVETWFLASAPQNEFISLWLKIFTPILEFGSQGFYKSLTDREDYSTLVQKLSDPSYLMLNITEQIASRSLQNVNMYLKKCEDSAFFIQESCGWDFNKINYILCRQKIPLNDFPILKLTSRDRELISYYRMFNLIHEDSIIGQLIKN